MVATDTIVGIAGAVLLAAVMVGVFVIEYNNEPTVPGDGLTNAATSIANFRALHVGLNATGDLDNDGKANHLDPDMDNNGVDDANQTGDLVVGIPYSGSISAPSPPATRTLVEIPFVIEDGNEGLAVTFFFNSTTPAPLPRAPALSFRVLNSDGETVLQGSTSTQTGTAVSSEESLAEPQTPGDYTLIVEETIPGPPTSFAGHIQLEYGAAHNPVEATPVR